MNISAINRVSFGMNVTPAGRFLAKKTLNAPKNDFNNEDYFKKTPALSTPRFAMDFDNFLNDNSHSKQDALKVASAIIVEHGTTKNAANNASFIRQLCHPATQDVINNIENKEEKKIILDAEKEVFYKNWDNPSLNKNETLSFLDAIKGAMTAKRHTTWVGVVQSGDKILS